MPPPPCESALIVNDNEDMTTSLCDLLELHGVRCATAFSIGEVEAHLASGFRPSAAIVDLLLGSGETGEDLIDRLRADPVHTGVRIIVVSGDVHRMQALAHKIDGHLLKPFDANHLIDTLRRVCQRP